MSISLHLSTNQDSLASLYFFFIISWTFSYFSVSPVAFLLSSIKSKISCVIHFCLVFLSTLGIISVADTEIAGFKAYH